MRRSPASEASDFAGTLRWHAENPREARYLRLRNFLEHGLVAWPFNIHFAVELWIGSPFDEEFAIGYLAAARFFR